MKVKADLAFSDLRARLLYKTLVFTDKPFDNFKILDAELNTINLAKCGLNDLEVEQIGSGAYLAYLLQSRCEVPFGVCPKAKMWFSQAGFRNRCIHEGAQIPVRCHGSLDRCTIPANKPKSE